MLRLLARGRTGVFIQHELCVSYNTIKAHVKHIYQKLDVHTHQELIDLVRILGSRLALGCVNSGQNQDPGQTWMRSF